MSHFIGSIIPSSWMKVINRELPLRVGLKVTVQKGRCKPVKRARGKK